MLKMEEEATEKYLEEEYKKYKHTIKYLKVIDADQRQGLLSFALSKREDL